MELVRRLSPAGKAQIKALIGARPDKFLSTLGAAWLVIAISIALAIYLDNIFASIIAIYVIATRQNLLGLLIHEQTHYLGLRNKFGDQIANLLAGYPLLVMTVEGYAQVHLRHHRYYFTPQDPDFLRKRGPDWTFPMRPSRFAKLVLQDLCGVSLVKFAQAKKAVNTDDGLFKRKHPSPSWLRPLFFILLAVILTLVHGWPAFLLYWMLPLATILPVIVRWGAICEHSYGEEGAGVEETSPIILPTLLGRIFLPNLNFTLHPYHHHLPGVAFANLPAVHEIFREEQLIREDQVYEGQLAYLRHILGTARGLHAIQAVGPKVA